MNEQSSMQLQPQVLPNASMVLTLSVISVVCAFLLITSFIGIILAAVALFMGDAAQNQYITHPQPTAWSNYGTLKTGMIWAVIGFVVNGVLVAFFLNTGVMQAMAEMNFK